MTSRDHAISVRRRLLNLSRSKGEDFQRLLVRYAIERLLYRLSVSPYAEDFVLKGGTLFALWMGKPHRATKDLDLLARGAPDAEGLVAVFQEVSAIVCDEDGVLFDRDTISGDAIRKDAAYAGVRIVVRGQLAGARVKVQVDIGLGDATVPEPATVEVTSLLGLRAARLRAYARETVVAEKLEALVVLGLTTSRMKDLYDLDVLRRNFPFDVTVVDAVRATFSRRGTPIPRTLPIGLSDAFVQDPVKQTQWRAFVRKADAADAGELAEVVEGLRAWLWPVLQDAATGSPRP